MEKNNTDLTIVREFMRNIRPLDLLVFRGHGLVADIISLAEDVTTDSTSTDITHVEVVLTREWCPKIARMHKRIVTAAVDSDQMLLAYGSTLSGAVADLETGKPAQGVQIRVLEDILLKYFRSEHANVGVCRLLHNPIETMDAESLKHRLSVCYASMHGRKYNTNPAALVGSMLPVVRPIRDLTNNILSSIGQRGVFCSELVSHVYIATGVITDATDGTIDGKILNPADVVPSDFLGGDADEGLVKRICEDPIWIK